MSEEPEASGRHGKNFLANLISSAGLSMMVVCGVCTSGGMIFTIPAFLTNDGWGPTYLQLAILFGVVPFAVGAGLFFLGRRMRR